MKTKKLLIAMMAFGAILLTGCNQAPAATDDAAMEKSDDAAMENEGETMEKSDDAAMENEGEAGLEVEAEASVE